MLSVARPTLVRAVTLALSGTAMLSMVPVSLAAQAFNYPAMQTSTVSTRDYTAAIVGGAGSTFLLQWREGAGRGMHWQFDGGVADPRGDGDPLLFAGAGLGKQLTRATGEQPLDVLLTASAGVAFGGNVTSVRVPVGVSLGHRFALEQGMSLTPFVHPRLSLDACGNCGSGGDSRTTVSANFDVGAHWQANDRFGLRLVASFSGSDVVGSDGTVALGFHWTPAGLTRR